MTEPEPPDEQPPDKRSFEADPLADYPVGPDDLGNAVVHGFGFVARGWRWLVGRVR